MTAVPHTGRRRRCKLWRRPRNACIKRALLGALGTLRGVFVPPSSYDDMKISANSDRSWKRHRRSQWRGIDE